jgi:hypothetical protein
MKKFLLLLAFFVHFGILSQVSFGIKFGGLAVHHQKVDPNYYRLSIDKKGRFVGYLGVSFVATYHINQYLGIKFIQTIMPFDCAGKRSGITHLGIDFQDRIIGIQNTTHQLSASFGPLIYYRKNWHQVANYTPNHQFVKQNKKGNWERKFIWYAGQIQYDFSIDERHAISTNFFPGYPHIYTFNTGIQLTNEPSGG